MTKTKFQVFVPVQKILENKEFFLGLSANPLAIDFLETFLEENPGKTDWIDWNALCQNRNAWRLLKKYPEKINLFLLSSDDGLISYLEENHKRLNEFDWSVLDWRTLSYGTKNFIYILKHVPFDKFRHFIVWENLCIWPYNSEIIELLEKNADRLDWCSISRVPHCLQLIMKNTEKVDWIKLASNPNIFIESTGESFLKKRMDILREELLAEALHPKRVAARLEHMTEDQDLEDVL